MLFINGLLLAVFYAPLAACAAKNKFQCRPLNSCIDTTFLDKLPNGMSQACASTCQNHKAQQTKSCKDNYPGADCAACMEEVKKTVSHCRKFQRNVKKSTSACDRLERQLTKCCSHNNVCKVCHDIFCQNGGVCKGGPNILSCKCLPGFTGIYCHKSQCGTNCKNGGKCTGPNTCACPSDYAGKYCERKRLGTKLNPAPNAQAILNAGDSVGSGLYWIQPPGEDIAAQTYCDMTYNNGGWMLASYGYVASTSTHGSNRNIPNMNNPMGYFWRPTARASRNGLINLRYGAVMMARNATYMLMAAGNNPNTAGVDQYSHVYRIDLRQNAHKITFANHNAVHGATGNGGIPKMHVTDFLVVGLKGEVGVFERFALAESLGVGWTDTYPTGYGFNEVGVQTYSFVNGPFFPSVHSGDRPGKCAYGAPCRVYDPDISQGTERYVHKGWYSANNIDNIGQTSIWFK